MERWLPVPGWPEYEVSDQGRVKSLARVVMRSNGVPNSVRERILRATPTCGYLQVVLVRPGDRAYRKVHHLVLEAFIGPCPEGMECLHGPGGPLDNRLESIRWGTKKENQADRVRDNTTDRGELSSWAKLTEADVREIRSRYTGVKGQMTLLAAEYGVSRKNVNSILLKRSWAWME